MCEKSCALKDCDWDTADAEFTIAIEGKSKESKDYLGRTKARCFVVSKEHGEGNYRDVIEDASCAMHLSPGNTEARCVRAYGYYLNGNYERAIADCKAVIGNETEASNTNVFCFELLATIYSNMGRYPEAAEYYREALKFRIKQSTNWLSASPLLFDKYREACKRVKGD